LERGEFGSIIFIGHFKNRKAWQCKYQIGFVALSVARGTGAKFPDKFHAVCKWTSSSSIPTPHFKRESG
jgi:hypothetical protein